MMKIAFKIVSIFWLFSPILFGVGRLCGYWNYVGKDWFIFLGLMGMSALMAFLNYQPNEEV